MHVLEVCVDMQNNISRMIELVKQFIQNYQNQTINQDYDWTNVTIEQRIAKLKIVQQNLLQLNFDMIDDLLRKWFEKSLEVWENMNLKHDEMKNDIDDQFANLRNISDVADIVVKKCTPNEWPYQKYKTGWEREYRVRVVRQGRHIPFKFRH